jgi:splicing factor 3B subunit 3
MYLYSITLQKASCVVQAVHGNFSGSKHQEIIVTRGKIIELLRPDPNTGKVHTVLSVEAFGEIRSLVPFRLTGGNKDYVVIGGDSGRIVVLEYIPQKNTFEKVHQETFGKSGCRRIVPGQYLAADPKGRAVMVSAVEKQKFVYVLNRDAAARLTISSPLEAHKAHTLVFHTVGMDVGYDNPLFGCIEMDYEEADQDPTGEAAQATQQTLTFYELDLGLNHVVRKYSEPLDDPAKEADQDPTGEAAQATQQTLTFYELDLGLNHVVRKYSEPLDDPANLLIAVPGGGDGPSGVLVCCENYIIYKNFGDQPDIKCPIPRRRHDLENPDRGMLIVCSTTHKTKAMFFVLVQSEQGDVFKITLDMQAETVTEIKMKYFDTLPVCSSMCVLKSGFLFCSAEFGNHVLYQIAHLGDNDDEPEFSSAMPLEEGETFFFAPRGLKNLVQADEIDSLSPIMNCKVANLLNEDTPQLYITCGRGPRSTLRILKHGLEVTEMAVSELPANPNAVWTVKKTAADVEL